MSLNAWFYGVPAGERAGHETIKLVPIGQPAKLSPWHVPRYPRPMLQESKIFADAGVKPGTCSDQQEGIAILVWREGWSLAFLWDRSADTRGNCSASIVVDSLLQAAEVREVIGGLYLALLVRIEGHLKREIVCTKLIIQDPIRAETAP